MVLAENVGDFKLSNEKIKIIAEVDDQIVGKQSVKLEVKLPPGLHLLKIIPETIDIVVKKSE
jgi:hypothetical protein